MDAIENAAFVSLGRACGFAGLFVFVLMVGLSFDPPLAARTGGLIGFGVVGLLLVYGLRAPSRPYQRTEAWLILPKDHRPPPLIAQRLVGRALRDAAFSLARRGTAFSSMLLVVSFVLRFI